MPKTNKNKIIGEKIIPIGAKMVKLPQIMGRTHSVYTNFLHIQPFAISFKSKTLFSFLTNKKKRHWAPKG